ncbi:MAG: DNA-binding protein, partial [Ferruginibacter sp.]|nr:DNA-binding protein [Ferruginibacter sp.]
VLPLLVVPGNKKNFTCDDSCWIQYEFQQPFACRTVTISSRTNYQSNRLLIQVSNDGIHFTNHTRLQSPRHGWQDWDENYTHSIKPVTAKYFRFIYDKKGSEPGAEDLDAAKWKPVLKVAGIELSGEAKINQYEGKNGSVWRISPHTTKEQIAGDNCVPLKSIIDITSKFDKTGRLNWNVPAGRWTILRMGHTSTGHRNDTGGGGKGLESDKFNPEVTKLQFDNWFGTFFNKVEKEITDSVLKIFHVDSWECGSQNWSPVFRKAFMQHRGYDLYNYLPIMTGVPLESADASEQFLQDIRETISQLITDNFYTTLAKLAHEKGCSFVAESVAPTMVSDGMLHYKQADIPMGEFWLRSPTHDKPNDMMDAISGAHIYGKPIIQAEAFTELRLLWDEHPGMLKSLQDRNYALGINRLVYHVFMHNPWTNRKPGMTLDGIGLFFQRDQTWWKQGKAWVEYARRCQALLQVGKPVVDIAVFTGEEIPRRSVLPENLIKILPGIVGKERVLKEETRLVNVGEPMMQSPPGVNHSANITEPSDWIDPLNGYAYDSYNKDALLHLSKVSNGNIVLNGGATYKLLVLPGSLKMNPNGGFTSVQVAGQLKKIVEQGATILVNEQSLVNREVQKLSNASGKLMQNTAQGLKRWKLGKGMIIQGPYTAANFEAIGIQPDFISTDDGSNTRCTSIAWTHRTAPGIDIYFISNQKNISRTINVSLRVTGRQPELWDAVTGDAQLANDWKIENGRTKLPVRLAPNGSIFIVLQQAVNIQSSHRGNNWIETKTAQTLTGSWTVNFDTTYGGYAKPVVFDSLQDWSKNVDTAIRFYSGTASYHKTFDYTAGTAKNRKAYLDLGNVANIGEVFVNGINCGIVWTAPYQVDITKAIHTRKNELKIEVTNTWSNRVVGDQRLPEEKRLTHTNAPFRLQAKPLLEAGLLGPVTIEINN